MHVLKYYSHDLVSGIGDVYVARWPFEDTSRDKASMLAALGNRIIIDNKVHDVISFETYCLSAPVRKGELVGVVVAESADQPVRSGSFLLSDYFAQIEMCVAESGIAEQVSKVVDRWLPHMMKFCKGRVAPATVRNDIERVYWNTYG